ncbi:MAG: ShlB/FhaC/HecB family hemolysin secretion/activation protein [Verrucomicrobiae bacterium]|nr:ShlB/FhaC/HecB family hemolysin secretion/activation protein [Verrucomicrobiae bacterium]
MTKPASLLFSFSLTSVLLVMLTLCPLKGQDFERIAPKTLPQQEGTATLPAAPPQTAEAASDEAVLVKSLKALIFVGSPDKVRKEGVPGAQGISAEGVPLLKKEEFTRIASDYMGKPVSRASLNKLTRDIILFYRKNDRPVVDVAVPEQDITEGVVQYIVLEGRLGCVKTEGNKWFSSKTLIDEIDIKPGQTVSARELTENVNWLNGNPFRLVNAILTPGKEKGETDIVLKTKDRFPARFYAGYEDSGNDPTGDERIIAGMNWGDAFFLDQQLNYQFTADPHCNKMTAHSGSWIVPLPWHHRLTSFGSYSESRADMANPLFDLGGMSWQASTRYSVPLPTEGPYSHEATAGFDFKQSNNNLDFGGAQVFDTTSDINQFMFGYISTLRDDWGSTTFDFSLFYSPGGWTPRNRDFNFDAARQGAYAEYRYQKFVVQRVTKLPADFTWILKGTGQFTDCNLLSSEQLGFGGYSSIRGYDEREVNGDEGYIINTEIRTPSVSLGQVFGLEKAVDQLQFLGFFDYGCAMNHELLPGEDPHIQLAGAGPGLRYTISPYCTVRFDYGWQLYDTTYNQRYNSRGHLGVVFSY